MSDENESGSIYTTDNHNIVVPGGTEVTVKDIVVFERGGEVVGRLDAKCDFADLDPSLHQMAVSLLMGKRIRLHLPTQERLERMDRWDRVYEERKTSYEALPWYRKLFAFPPQYGVE